MRKHWICQETSLAITQFFKFKFILLFYWNVIILKGKVNGGCRRRKLTFHCTQHNRAQYIQLSSDLWIVAECSNLHLSFLRPVHSKLKLFHCMQFFSIKYKSHINNNNYFSPGTFGLFFFFGILLAWLILWHFTIMDTSETQWSTEK